jgi:hypothetical protein
MHTSSLPADPEVASPVTSPEPRQKYDPQIGGHLE